MTKQTGIKNPNANLNDFQINDVKNAFWNLKPNLLIEDTLRRNQGTLTQNGTLCIKTGKFTGRSPKDRFIVKDNITESTVDWNDINKPFEPAKFDNLFNKVTSYFKGKDVFIKDAAVGNDPTYQIKVRVFAEHSWSANFVHNMFIRLDNDQLMTFEPEWVVYVAPGFLADPVVDGTRSSNFSIINFEKKKIIIGGTGYTGEIKKGMFSVL
ncbi:MAG: phosphoenolpyruvate carboxykinase (ATP), partial [Bacteroidia bacterium]|nr:phosphoenolpyruvate carboxykinase (ATP) [Bacteroidia bacterium]